MGEVVVAVLNRPDDAEALLDAGAFLLDMRRRRTAQGAGGAHAADGDDRALRAGVDGKPRGRDPGGARGLGGQLRKVVEGWTARAQHPGIRTDWLDVEGDAVRGDRRPWPACRCDRDRAPDEPGQSAHARVHACGAVRIRPARSWSSRPALQGTLGQVAAIAWKNDERAVKAVRACIPILRKARSVHVLCANRPAEMPAVSGGTRYPGRVAHGAGRRRHGRRADPAGGASDWG